MTSLFLAFMLAVLAPSGTTTVTPPLDVRKEVIPILDLCAKTEATQSESQNERLFHYGKMVGTLFEERTKTSDEALVVLMNFYIGESLGDDLLHQITVRGKRMLPLLLKYRDVRVVFPEREYPSSVLLSADVRTENFDNVIKSVKAGKIIGED